MGKRLGWMLALCLFLTGCSKTTVVGFTTVETQPEQPLHQQEQGKAEDSVPAPEPVLEVAELEGEALSPDGQFEIKLVGYNDTVLPSGGITPPEYVRICDKVSGDTLWEGDGAYTHQTLWSTDGRYLVLGRTCRISTELTIFETETWTSWTVGLPEYAFLQGDWGSWVDEDTLHFYTSCGEMSEMCFYRCNLWMENGALAGELVNAAEPLEGKYDFNHNGILETVTLVGNCDTLEESSFWLVQVWEEETLLWTDCAATSHAGWNNIFALELDGKDYLLRYHPTMYQGFANYSYQIFSLGEEGNEHLLQANGVDFDINFGGTLHDSFDPAAIAAFLEDVHGYLNESTILVSTDGCNFSSGGSGTAFREDGYLWDEFCPYDESLTLQANLEHYQEKLTEARA